MIQNIISNIKLSATFKIDEEVDRLTAANSIQKLLNEIDFNSEIVPIDNTDKLKNLLESIKEKPLSQKELKLVSEITNNFILEKS